MRRTEREEEGSPGTGHSRVNFLRSDRAWLVAGRQTERGQGGLRESVLMGLMGVWDSFETQCVGGA